MSKLPALREEWTADEASDADLQYRLAGGQLSPNAPWEWWTGKQALREMAAKHSKKPAMVHVMEAIDTCAVHEWPIPSWAAAAFHGAMTGLRAREETRTWDDAFGPAPYLKPGATRAKTRDALARHHRALAIYLDIVRDRLPISSASFKAVGQRYGVSRGTAEADYRSIAKRWPDQRTPMKRGRKSRAKGASR